MRHYDPPSDLETGTTTALEGKILAVEDGRLLVSVDGQVYGPCRYMPRPERDPEPDDPCLVLDPENGLPWVAAWDLA